MVSRSSNVGVMFSILNFDTYCNLSERKKRIYVDKTRTCVMLGHVYVLGFLAGH